jgi:hypothetical protein
MIHREQQAIHGRPSLSGNKKADQMATPLRAEAEIKTEAALGPTEPLSEKTRIKSEHDKNALSTC